MADTHVKPTHPRFQDLTGQTFGRWNVIEFAGMTERRAALWLCECSCPDKTRRVLRTTDLTRNRGSCGCYQREWTSEMVKRRTRSLPVPELTPALVAEICARFGVAGGIRSVPSVPGYLVSGDGRLFSIRPLSLPPGEVARELTLVATRDGHLTVSLQGGGLRLRRLVHQLVAEAFLPPRPDDCYLVRHLDDDPTNNSPENLAWGTDADNHRDAVRNGRTLKGERAPGAKLTAPQVLEIRRLAAGGVSRADIGRRFGICPQQAGMIVRRRHWRHLEEEPSGDS
jgi:hypothetical protein